MRFEAGRPVAIDGTTFDDPVALVQEANAVGGRHGLGMSDQIENRIIEAKSRGIYEAPGMALLWIAYERLLNAVHNEDTLAELPRRRPPARAAALRGQVVRPAVAMRLRDSLQRWVGVGRHRRGDASACAGATTTPSSPPTGRRSPTNPSGCRWSAPRTPRSGPPTASASSPCATSTSPTPGRSSSSTPSGRLLVAGEDELLGALEAGGADRIAENPNVEPDDERALDAAAMEHGHGADDEHALGTGGSRAVRPPSCWPSPRACPSTGAWPPTTSPARGPTCAAWCAPASSRRTRATAVLAALDRVGRRAGRGQPSPSCRPTRTSTPPSSGGSPSSPARRAPSSTPAAAATTRWPPPSASS